MRYINIEVNHFRSSSIAAAPTLFEEEPLYVASGHTLVQGVLCQGPATTANINNVFIENNSFEYGCTRIGWVPSSVRNNSFLRGLIIVRFTSGAIYSKTFAHSTLTNGNINMSSMDACVPFFTLSQMTNVAVPVRYLNGVRNNFNLGNISRQQPAANSVLCCKYLKDIRCASYWHASAT